MPYWPNTLNQITSFKSGVGYGGDKNKDGALLKKGLKEAGQKEKQSDHDVLIFLQGIVPPKQKGVSKASFSPVPLVDSMKLVQVLQEVFHNQIMTDWSKRNTLYCQALTVCEFLASSQEENLVDLLTTPADNSDPDCDVQETRESTICSCLKSFSELAEMVVSMAHKQQSSATVKASSTAAVAESTIVDATDVKLAENVLRVYQLVKTRIDETGLKRKKDAAILSITTPVDSYKEQLGPLRFGLVTSFTQQHYSHRQTLSNGFPFTNMTPGYHPAKSNLDSIPSTQLTRNLFKELTSYKSVLPLEYGSSIFVRALEDRLDLIRVLIMGPDETPYGGGCFIFDVQITSSYPSQPPKVQFINHGNKRFNPNLYQDGKVCLSLLGTWQGPGWVAGISTLLQVLISIQSLILVSEPYFNEPGYESELGTERGGQQSRRYNETIRQYTLSHSIEPFLLALTNNQPSLYPEFDDVIRLHFTLKRPVISNQLRKWKNENESLQTSVNKLLGYLDKLASPNTTATSQRKRHVPSTVSYNINADGVIEIEEDQIQSRQSKNSKIGEVLILGNDDDVKIVSKSDEVVDLT